VHREQNLPILEEQSSLVERGDEGLVVNPEGFVDLLNLSDEKHLEKYRQITNLAAKGYAQIHVEDRQFVDGKFIVLVRWTQFALQYPEHANRGLRSNNGQFSFQSG